MARQRRNFIELGSLTDPDLATVIEVDQTTGDTIISHGLYGEDGSSLVEVARIDRATGKFIQAHGGFLQGESKETTSGTFIDLTDVPSWAKRITLSFNGVSGSGSSRRMLQLSVGGVLQTAGYNNIASQLNASAVGSDTGNAAGFTLEQASTAAAAGLSGQVVLVQTSPETNQWSITSALGNINGTRQDVTSGSTTISGTIDRIRLTTITGTDTFDAGRIGVIYEG